MFIRISKYLAVITLLISLISFQSLLNAKENADAGHLFIRFQDEEFKIKSGKSYLESYLSGEAMYKVTGSKEGISFELKSFGLVADGVKTQKGETGNVSINLKPEKSKTTYDHKKNIIKSDIVVEVHYPLIDKIKGFKKPRKGEREIDDFRSYTEEFRGKFICELREIPKFDETRILKKGSKVLIELEISQKVLGALDGFVAEFPYVVVVEFYKLYLQETIKIQPVFIRYTPATGCNIGTTTTATTGGSYTILRDRAIEMWSRCCINLNFLPVVYVDDDDYRILTSAEAPNLRAEYDDANAIEVFFVENFDPVGQWGGGATWSSGTASAQIITCDTNLPVNLYNLAHELGHALGLYHPPGNSTPGSLMEPSGFCEDNPALMSDENCDNVSNPLLRHKWRLCWRKTNMP